MTDEVFTFAEEEEGTGFTQSATAEVRGFLRPLQPLLARMTRKALAEDHENLKSILEGNEE